MTARPLRRDARENRERVLDAAAAVFGEQGIDASTETIASRAGVGVGTVFRHYPTKRELLEAVLDHIMTQIAEAVEKLADSDEPGQAFFEALEGTALRASAKRAVAEALAASTPAAVRTERKVPMKPPRYREALRVLLERAQEQGAVRDDVGIDEVSALLFAAASAAEHARTDASLRTKTLRIMFDGLRPRAPVSPRRRR